MKQTLDIEMHGLWEFHIDRLREMKVERSGTNYKINGKDLREALFCLDKVDIHITSHLLYILLIAKKVHVKGFYPDKTRLRAEGLSCAEVNKILPGSFPSEEK